MNYLENLFSLEGRTVIITGGGGVIAAALAEGYLQAGANVSLWNRSEGSMEAVAVELRSRIPRGEGKLQTLVVDTGNEGAVKGALEESIRRFGRVDILVNGVGGNKGKGPFIDIDADTFKEVLEMNLLSGLIVPTKVAARHWIETEQSGCCIINLASMTSYKPLSGVWAYDAAKSAVLNLTSGAAREFAPWGIRVNGIAPGFFLGRQNRALLIDTETEELTPRGRSIIERTPFGRFGKTEELIGTALYLSSERAAGFVTGVTVPVDGGFLADNI